MNKVIISGRLTKEPELRNLNNGMICCNFTVAVDRPYKQQTEIKADFFNCIAWQKKGEFVKNWCSKGRLVLITGEINNRVWQAQDGQNHTTTEITVETIELLDKKNSTPQVNVPAPVPMQRTSGLTPVSQIDVGIPDPFGDD